jgi:hypothetical protein
MKWPVTDAADVTEAGSSYCVALRIWITKVGLLSITQFSICSSGIASLARKLPFWKSSEFVA